MDILAQQEASATFFDWDLWRHPSFLYSGEYFFEIGLKFFAFP
jgi:hypothetical protein